MTTTPTDLDDLLGMPLAAWLCMSLQEPQPVRFKSHRTPALVVEERSIRRSKLIGARRLR